MGHALMEKRIFDSYYAPKGFSRTALVRMMRFANLKLIGEKLLAGGELGRDYSG